MSDRRTGQDPGPLGYPAPDYGRGFGRDFGGGLGQGYDGAWGQGYGASTAYSDYRDGFIDPADGARAGPHAGKGPNGWRRTDARLREQVCERLSEDRLLDARGIEVDVDDGVVTLEGHVPGAAGVVLAEDLAAACGGVREVRNHLSVQPPARPDARPRLGARTGVRASPLREGERDAAGREEGPRHLPFLAM